MEPLKQEILLSGVEAGIPLVLLLPALIALAGIGIGFGIHKVIGLWVVVVGVFRVPWVVFVLVWVYGKKESKDAVYHKTGHDRRAACKYDNRKPDGTFREVPPLGDALANTKDLTMLRSIKSLGCNFYNPFTINICLLFVFHLLLEGVELLLYLVKLLKVPELAVKVIGSLVLLPSCVHPVDALLHPVETLHWIVVAVAV